MWQPIYSFKKITLFCYKMVKYLQKIRITMRVFKLNAILETEFETTTNSYHLSSAGFVPLTIAP